MHIPKTAGTSITSLLEDNISLIDAITTKKIRNSYYSNRVDYGLVQSAKLVAGHLPLGMAALMHDPVRKIVFLRNPVDLSHSLFNYMKRLGEIPENEVLADFIQSPRGEVIKDVQVKWLANAVAVNVVQHRQPMPHEFGWSAEARDSHIDDKAFEDAMANLEQFDFVGIVEQFETSISRLCDQFGFSRGFQLGQLNVGHYQRQRDETLTELLSASNRYDMQLYQFAERRFADTAASSRVQPSASGCDKIAAYFFLDMDEPVRHKGLHSREFWADWHGIRWTSKVASIYPEFEVAANVQYMWELMVLAVISPEAKESARVLIDDVPLEYTLSYQAGIWYYRGVFSSPKRILNPELKIVVPFATEPSTMGISSDPRTLGLAIKAFKMMPVETCAVAFA